MPDGKVCPENFRGWILKWTNYIKGYQKRWFVLANGVLSYYRTQEEMAHVCRGSISLAAAFIDTVDSTNFVITNGPSQVYHLRALSEVERQRWVTALELAKAKAIKKLDSECSEDEAGEGGAISRGASAERGLDPNDDGSSPSAAHDHLLLPLQEKLKELTAAYSVVVKTGRRVSESTSDAAMGASKSAATRAEEKENLALFKITSAAMVKAAEEFVSQARNTERHWSRTLQQEHSLRLQLQDNMEALASQMHGLEDEARLSIHGSLLCVPSTDSLELSSSVNLRRKKAATYDCPEKEILDEPDAGSGGDEEEEKFFDAPEVSVEEEPTTNLVSLPSLGLQSQENLSACYRQSISTTSVNDTSLTPDTDVVKDKCPQVMSDRRMTIPAGPTSSFFEDVALGRAPVKHRTRIPPRPNCKLNLWTVMKNSIGKDLSKIPMPVNLNEPLSLLQRMSEDLLYSSLLTKAVHCSSTMEEAAYVAAFINSAYATVNSRINKPFNPLLYETYECDRRDDPKYGWRLITEQVTHHPPMFAMHVEHRDWTFWQEYTVASSFRGKYLVVYPLGCCHVVMHASKSHYTWTKVNTTVHNIIVGTLWIDQSGELKVINHTTKEECHVKYHAYSYFSREKQRKITGTVQDSSGAAQYVVKGHWDEEFTLARVLSQKGKTLETTPKTLWRPDSPQPGSEVMYGFSKFVCSLNEPEEGVAPTDCRLRPDIRVMEKQDFDKANKEKVKLEEKQRVRRRKREAVAAKAAEAAAAGNMEEAERLEKASTITPVWFSKDYDHLTNTMMHVYKGGYWEAKATGNWDQLNLPDIY